MARYGKDPWRCPFCNSGTKHHELKTGAGGYSIHMTCTKCECLGPKVLVGGGRNNAWRIILKGYRPDLAQKARDLFYGVPAPVLSSTVPTLV